MKTKISEARLNDLCYLTLKNLFFGPMFGEGHNPRECDIRICMNLVVPESISGPQAAILFPDEIAPKSHTKMYNVNLDDVLTKCIEYMEDHWLKADVEEIFDSKSIRSEMRDFFVYITSAAMNVPEDECAEPLKYHGNC